MSLPKNYQPKEAEPRLRAFWQELGIYHFDPDSEAPVYSIDTPPPTVSGHLHLGHVYSYSHPDFIARFWRMNGRNVYYPMGYDDNGLPTERLVEKQEGVHATQIGRQAFIERCLQASEKAVKDYEALWQRLGLSIDWRYTYRTIDEQSRRLCQWSFIDLCHRGLAYRKEAPAIWCPECRTAIAQAELNDLERESEFVTLQFFLTPAPLPANEGRLREGGGVADKKSILIATTRPELLPACVAIFVHPDDIRYREWIGQQATVPIFGQRVPILSDPAADPGKGTGAVMCCTFGDTTDVTWWNTHHLPLIEAIDRNGRMTAIAGDFAGLTIGEARKGIKQALDVQGYLQARQPTSQTIRVHERCDTPVEYIVLKQWFINVLDFKRQLLEAGAKIRWHPDSMAARYRGWVENLGWDWCISRQRYYGVPFPVWFCLECGETVFADEANLPVEPATQSPGIPCPKCQGTTFIPEEDIFDTWMTSSLSPQIAGSWGLGDQDGTYARVYPYSLRPQAHDIIRTWAFYTIVKSLYHFDTPPWTDVLISGWGLAGEGMDKISKSRGGGPMAPMEMIEKYSADAVRYWAASTAPGKDSVISEEKIQMGGKLVTKLWNVARFAERFLSPHPRIELRSITLSPADRWILARAQRLIRRATDLLTAYEYAAAKSEIETFFWGDLADNYLEMAKQRLYDSTCPTHEGARATLGYALLTIIKLFAPFLPYVTEEIFGGLFASSSLAEPVDGQEPAAVETPLVEQAPAAVETYHPLSIHRATWPQVEPILEDTQAEAFGETLVEIATAIRRYKSEHNLSLGSEIKRVQLAAGSVDEQVALHASVDDLKSITRTQQIEVTTNLEPALLVLLSEPIGIAVEP